MKPNTSRPKRHFPIFRVLILLLALGVFLYASAQLMDYYSEYRKSDNTAQDLREQAVISIPASLIPEATQAGTVPVTPEEAQEDKPEDMPPDEPEDMPAESLPDYPAISYTIPLMVDFTLLKEQNPDIIGWIYCADTPINYPIVQTEDNEYYLHRLPDGTSNANGSIFADFRNLADFSDPNTMIYGHNMKNGSMFASLLNYRQQSYYDAHPCLWILTPERAYRVDLMAGYTTPSDGEIYNVFSTAEEMQSVLSRIMEDSSFCPAEIPEDIQNIVTLSTCTYEYNTARYVVIGNLVPAEYLPQEELDRIMAYSE
jgi:sortase B